MARIAGVDLPREKRVVLKYQTLKKEKSSQSY